jgi:hypothetical protein
MRKNLTLQSVKKLIASTLALVHRMNQPAMIALAAFSIMLESS